MVHAWTSDEYIHFALMYTTDHIFPVLTIKQLVNQISEATTSHKLETDMKPSVPNLTVLFYPCVVQKSTAHVHTKALNMRHQLKKGFWVSSLKFYNIKLGYLIYVPSTQKIEFSNDVLFDKTFSSALAYTSHPYSEALVKRPTVLYILYTTSYH